MDFLKDIIESISTFDLIYLIITILSLLQCLKKGFKMVIGICNYINYFSKN